MQTAMKNYHLKLRLFKCEKIDGIRNFKILNEVDYLHENFKKKSKVFENYLNSVISLIDLPIKGIRWIKGDTWHDDMIFIEVAENDNDIYYKVSHFSS